MYVYSELDLWLEKPNQPFLLCGVSLNISYGFKRHLWYFLKGRQNIENVFLLNFLCKHYELLGNFNEKLSMIDEKKFL